VRGVKTMMDRERELQLIARLKAHDGEAFDEIYAAFHARLFSFLARLAQRRDVAEDLAEETWLRLVTHAPGLRDDSRLGPWLFTVARNLHASYCRSRMLDFEATAVLHLWPVPPAEPSPFDTASGTELQRRVDAAVATLPGAYREALLLVAIDGLTPQEAAVMCGVKPETMRQRISRARAMLAKRLEGSAAAAAVPLMKEVLP
ncbi:MAG TPA: RNA polymerase sigma factor, partial [Vicinamibacterales bacterium]|nr:RNA polymerase sigma factor [Vicinamibacterales bacterium]